MCFVLVIIFFFGFRSNSVFSGAVRIYAKDIDVFEKVGDRAKRGLQRKGGPGVLPKPLARNNLLPVLGDPFQLGVWGRRAAATVTMGDIAGRYTSQVTARLPSAALWSACSLTVTDCDFLHLRRANCSVLPRIEKGHGAD